MDDSEARADRSTVVREELTPTEVDRLWQHGAHLDTMLFQRGNLFLVAESLLVVSYTSLLPDPGTSGPPILAATYSLPLLVAVMSIILFLIALGW